MPDRQCALPSVTGGSGAATVLLMVLTWSYKSSQCDSEPLWTVHSTGPWTQGLEPIACTKHYRALCVASVGDRVERVEECTAGTTQVMLHPLARLDQVGARVARCGLQARCRDCASCGTELTTHPTYSWSHCHT